MHQGSSFDRLLIGLGQLECPPFMQWTDHFLCRKLQSNTIDSWAAMKLFSILIESTSTCLVGSSLLIIDMLNSPPTDRRHMFQSFSLAVKNSIFILFEQLLITIEESGRTENMSIPDSDREISMYSARMIEKFFLTYGLLLRSDLNREIGDPIIRLPSGIVSGNTCSFTTYCLLLSIRYDSLFMFF